MIMLLAGLGVLLFGLAESCRVSASGLLDDVLTTTSQWQGAVTQGLQSWGTPVLIALVVIAVASVVVVLWRGRVAPALQKFLGVLRCPTRRYRPAER